ncbi:MAG: YihY/virulence factor BrkB family protein [Deltaproteobacteria bacterium]|nr:YihY/virulence factor BrkB family protein [Deltaproteobacteria bacterium]
MKGKGRSPRQSKGFYQKLEADHIFFLASGLAFNFLICFIPFILVILSVLGYFLHSSQEVLGYIRIYVEKMLPYASPRMSSNIVNLIEDRKWVGLIGFLGLIWTATRLFSSTRTVLDKTLEISWPHGYLKEKLYDLMMVCVSGLLFLVSIIMTGLIDLIKSFPDRLGIQLPGLLWIQGWGRLIGLTGGYLFSVLMFFILFRFLPSRRPSNRVALITSLLIAGLWDVAKYLFRLYVNLLNNFTAIYGSLGLLVVFIFWIYYSCLILVIGGEVVWILERRKRS